MGQWEIRGIIRVGRLPQLVNAPVTLTQMRNEPSQKEDWEMCPQI
jgi:hypothetical protein